jgi:hypothetical protein
MLTAQQKQQRLEDCIALLHDVDAMQQTALGDSEVCFDVHCALESLIDDLTDELKAVKT